MHAVIEALGAGPVEMGRAGRARVRERFLVTGAVERELRALAALSAPGTPA